MTIAETFDQQYRVDAATGCHVWFRAKYQNGYGHLKVFGRTISAHRYAWFRKHGRWPWPCALHRCDNRACVNPRHIFEGTKKQNTQDMLAKERLVIGLRHKGEANCRAKLTEKDVRLIRRAYARGESLRSLARRFPVSRPVVTGICKGIAWTHVAA